MKMLTTYVNINNQNGGYHPQFLTFKIKHHDNSYNINRPLNFLHKQNKRGPAKL